MKKTGIKVILFMLLVLACGYACSDNDSEKLPEHNPSEPIVLTKFFPDSGGLATRVILEGANFGSDTSQIKVYFNEKRAPVINARGDKMYVVAPRLPGNPCTVKVYVGDKEAVYDEVFKYTAQLTVTTIAGYRGAPKKFTAGPLSTTTFSALTGVVVDKDQNIFVSMYDGSSGIAHVSLKEGLSTWITGEVGAGKLQTPMINPETQVVYFPCDNGHTFVELNPLTMWMPRVRQIIYRDPTINHNKMKWKLCFAYNPVDKHAYTRYYQGTIVKFNLQSYEAEILAYNVVPDKDARGLAIDPLDPSKLYFSINDYHTIYVYDLETNKYEIFAGADNSSGWRDGHRLDAEFNSPRQICFDDEGIMYVADRNNHCIRSINREGLVTTICGIPRQWGYTDGPVDEATFDNPYGVAVDKEGNLYIAEDNNNRTLRKMTVE